jgi:hypothetical protein
VLDASSPVPTAVDVDSGAEAPTSTRLPPDGSLDRLLLSLGSRLVYSLATVVATCALFPQEFSFICRPTGGGAAAAAHRGDAHYTYKAASRFPPLPDFGKDALETAASLLRTLWMRLPLLRSPIAHAVSVAALQVSAMLGAVEVQVSRADWASGSAAETFHVEVPEEIVQVRAGGGALW